MYTGWSIVHVVFKVVRASTQYSLKILLVTRSVEKHRTREMQEEGSSSFTDKTVFSEINDLNLQEARPSSMGFSGKFGAILCDGILTSQ